MSGRRIVVAGIGNLMRHDDGAGPQVARRVAELAKEGGPVTALASPLGEPLDLLGSWDGADLAIVVDAVRSGAPPGTLTLDWLGAPGGLDPLPGDGRSPSTHGLGVADVYRLASAIGQAPPRVAVVGIEGQDFSHGEGLSAAVEAGIGEGVNVIMALAGGQLERAPGGTAILLRMKAVT